MFIDYSILFRSELWQKTKWKNIEFAKRNLYLQSDSNCKSLLKLREKKKEEHLKREEKKEETELEDIIGARFVFDQTIY